jgi:hypothetical protein
MLPTEFPEGPVYVTIQPHHLALDKTLLPRACLVTGFKISDFGDGAQFQSYTEAYKARMKYSALYDVQKAVVKYSIPVTFDGEIAEFAFGKAARQFTIGDRFEIANGILVTLQSGVVIEPEQKAYLVVNDDNGRSHVIIVALSDAELAAYRAHPETFFGRVLPVSKNIEDPLDLYAFFINANKETPREKLLDFLSDASDIERLIKLTDKELRYEYAERLTYWAMKAEEK